MISETCRFHGGSRNRANKPGAYLSAPLETVVMLRGNLAPAHSFVDDLGRQTTDNKFPVSGC